MRSVPAPGVEGRDDGLHGEDVSVTRVLFRLRMEDAEGSRVLSADSTVKGLETILSKLELVGQAGATR